MKGTFPLKSIVPLELNLPTGEVVFSRLSKISEYWLYLLLVARHWILTVATNTKPVYIERETPPLPPATIPYGSPFILNTSCRVETHVRSRGAVHSTPKNGTFGEPKKHNHASSVRPRAD